MPAAESEYEIFARREFKKASDDFVLALKALEQPPSTRDPGDGGRMVSSHRYANASSPAGLCAAGAFALTVRIGLYVFLSPLGTRDPWPGSLPLRGAMPPPDNRP